MQVAGENNRNPKSTVDVTPYGGDAATWDRFVERDPGGTFCHLWDWRTLMEDVLGHRTLYLAAHNRDGALRGILPLVEVRSRLTGRFLLSLPFLNDGGPLGDAPAREALAAEARREAEDRAVDLLELRTRAGISSDLDLDSSDLRTVRRRITVLLPLPDDPDVLWNDRFSSKLRSQVRRPMKAGLECRIGPAELDSFYAVFSRTMRDLGTPVLPKSFFEGLREAFPEQAVFAAVYKDGNAVAGGCGVRWQDEFEITWAGFLREHGRDSPNMLLYWGLMERMVDEGVSVFNFGRCAPGSGTHRFKKQWGGEDTELPWLQWSPDGTDATPDESRPGLRLASRLWMRMPLAAANRLGPFLARRLP